MTRAARRLLAVLLVVVAGIALTPRPPPLPDTGSDKLDHLAAFVALSVVAAAAFPAAGGRTAVALLAYGGAIELLQSVVPNRSAEWADWLADALGIGAGFAIAAAFSAASRRRRR